MSDTTDANATDQTTTSQTASPKGTVTISLDELRALIGKMSSGSGLDKYLGGDTLSVFDAAETLNKATDVGEHSRWDMRYTNLAIAAALPEEYRTKEVLEAVDIRGLLNDLSARGDKIKFGLSDEMIADAFYGAYQVSADATEDGVATKSLTNHVKHLTTKYTNKLDDIATGSLSPSQRQPLYDAASAVPSGLGLVPTADEKVLAVAGGAADPTTLTEGTGPTSDDLWAMFNSQWWDGKGATARDAVQQMIDYEAQAGAPPMPVDVTLTTPWNTLSPYSDPSLTRPKDTTVYGARNYIFEQTPQGVRTLQRNMRDAGVYDTIGRQIGDWGDASDQATLDAWNYVIAESYRRKTTPMRFLAEQGKTYWQTKQPEQFAQGAEANMIDSWATEIIGRPLSAQEKAMLSGYMLRMDRAGNTTDAAFAERQQTGSAGPTDVQNFIGTEMQQTVRDQQFGAGNGVLDYLNGVS